MLPGVLTWPGAPAVRWARCFASPRAHVSTQHDAHEPVAGLPTLVVHDQGLTLLDTRLSAELGLTEGLAVGVLVPWRTVRAGIDFRGPLPGAG
jgi:hypothetical protein